MYIYIDLTSKDFGMVSIQRELLPCSQCKRKDSLCYAFLLSLNVSFFLFSSSFLTSMSRLSSSSSSSLFSLVEKSQQQQQQHASMTDTLSHYYPAIPFHAFLFLCSYIYHVYIYICIFHCTNYFVSFIKR